MSLNKYMELKKQFLGKLSFLLAINDTIVISFGAEQSVGKIELLAVLVIVSTMEKRK